MWNTNNALWLANRLVNRKMCTHTSVYNLHGFNGKTLILCCTIIRAYPVNRVHGGRYNIFFNEQYLIICLKMYDIYTRGRIYRYLRASRNKHFWRIILCIIKYNSLLPEYWFGNNNILICIPHIVGIISK